MSFSNIQTISEISELLYSFLPGNPHPMADQSISFQGAAHQVGLGNLWSGGSKKPAIQQLLNNTLKFQRGRFCDLAVEIVEKAIIYRSNKAQPVTQEEIKQLNQLILKLDFKIPELWDSKFLDSLPRSQIETSSSSVEKVVDYSVFKQKLIELSSLNPQERGYAFEKFLNKIFAEFEMKPKGSFRITGEQIDGSFDLDSHTYLLEAKWQNLPSNESDLLILKGKVDGKAAWSRGLFVSFGGCSQDGLEAFSKGKQTNILVMDGQDLFLCLEKNIPLNNIIQAKARVAAETGDCFVSVMELINQNLV